MMDSETRDLLLDLDAWLKGDGPEPVMRGAFRARIKKALAAKRERALPPLAENLAAMGASAHSTGKPRRAPEGLTAMSAAIWLQGYDAASEAAIDAEAKG